HPADCVRSTRSSAPWRAQASSSAARSASRPSADCTAATATQAVSGPTRSASSSSGTSTTRTPRSACAAKGKVTLVKSPAATSTSAPSGTEAATNPTSGATWCPIATCAAGTPTSPAYAARAAAIVASKCGGSRVPAAQAAYASASACWVTRGGSPIAAVLRYNVSGVNASAYGHVLIRRP